MKKIIIIACTLFLPMLTMAQNIIERQEYMLNLVMDICKSDFKFNGFIDVMDYFKRIINVCKQMNYSVYQSENFEKYVSLEPFLSFDYSEETIH